MKIDPPLTEPQHPTVKICRIPDCWNEAKPHFDNGLYCGNELCDEHFEQMRQEARPWTE